MKKKNKEYKVPSRFQPFFAILKVPLKLIFKSKVINEHAPIPERAILISNHSAKSGPASIEVSLNHFNVKWGAHEMLGSFKERYKYLRNVLYMQKLGKGKFYATVKGFLEACFSKMAYKGMKFIPTYTDIRFSKTIKMSMKVLEANASICIFPEDSNEGYFDVLTYAFPGFVVLAEQYEKKHGEDVPIVPMYYHKKSRTIIVGEAFYQSKLHAEGLDREQIAEYGKNRINEIFFNNFASEEEKAKYLAPKEAENQTDSTANSNPEVAE